MCKRDFLFMLRNCWDVRAPRSSWRKTNTPLWFCVHLYTFRQLFPMLKFEILVSILKCSKLQSSTFGCSFPKDGLSRWYIYTYVVYISFIHIDLYRIYLSLATWQQRCGWIPGLRPFNVLKCIHSFIHSLIYVLILHSFHLNCQQSLYLYKIFFLMVYHIFCEANSHMKFNCCLKCADLKNFSL